MRMKLILGIALSSLLTACSLGDLNGFVEALPDQETLTIQTPQSNQSSNALTSGDDATMSEFYMITRKVSREVNHTALGLIGIVHEIVQHPPTTQEEERWIWGPHREGLDPVYFRLVAQSIGEQQYSYQLQYRPLDTGDDEGNYVTLIDGTADNSLGVEDGRGGLDLYIDHWAAAEPGACGQGKLLITYDSTVEPKSLVVEFEDFASGCPSDDADYEYLGEATYAYHHFNDGAGVFEFLANQDVHEGFHVPALPELFTIRSRWNASGEGRSDILVTNGDLEIEELNASECWDQFFNLTFAQTLPAMADPEHHYGSNSDCPTEFQEASFFNPTE